jgi:sulfur-oxidizing protein SoxX
MKQRFPDRGALREQLWDSTVRNPYSVMPPFGRHRVLTEEEIDLVLEYIYRY